MGLPLNNILLNRVGGGTALKKYLWRKCPIRQRVVVSETANSPTFAIGTTVSRYTGIETYNNNRVIAIRGAGMGFNVTLNTASDLEAIAGKYIYYANVETWYLVGSGAELVETPGGVFFLTAPCYPCSMEPEPFTQPQGVIEYVASDSTLTYPNNGVSNGYYYVPCRSVEMDCGPALAGEGDITRGLNVCVNGQMVVGTRTLNDTVVEGKYVVTSTDVANDELTISFMFTPIKFFQTSINGTTVVDTDYISTHDGYTGTGVCEIVTDGVHWRTLGLPEGAVIYYTAIRNTDEELFA